MKKTIHLDKKKKINLKLPQKKNPMKIVMMKIEEIGDLTIS